MILLDTDHLTLLKYPDRIALVNQTLLLSGNRSDFEQVPGLRVENWLD
jgi:hypothetical protein